MRNMIRTVVLLVLVAGCNGGDPWPPECGMSEDDLKRHMKAAQRLATGVLPSDIYDFDGNGAVDLNDLSRLLRAGTECE